MEPLVSIVTPCLNSERTIAKTIESVLSQTYSSIEYIIIDGGSTDNTLEIIRSYSSRFQGRLTVISEPDGGVYHAMNKGIVISTGTVIGIINSDDWYEPDAVSAAMARYHKIPAVIYGLTRIYSADMTYLYLDGNGHECLHQRTITHSGAFIHRSLYATYGLYSTDYAIVSDYEFFLRLYTNSVHFVQVEEVFSNFVLGGLSSTSTNVYYETYSLKRRYGIISFTRFSILCICQWIYHIVTRVLGLKRWLSESTPTLRKF